tara:strand:- start:2108 stop:3523 length:1416 start_codon:yes stop_codon:yes gene_type:complete
MPSISDSFETISGRQKITLAIFVVLMLLITGSVYTFVYQTKYVPIYADINAADAAVVLAQLDTMKVPYRMSEDGSSILVDSTVVDETRIKLDGSTLSFNGGEGFELFNDADYGMTEFVQKINFQRALQGELSRTIIGLTEVRYARVHLVLPEKSLFREAETAPKASVTLVPESGQIISSAQTRGIQQLIASAVDGMDANNVIILDEQGRVLTRVQSEDDSGLGAHLGRKQELEHYLTQKAGNILSQRYGAQNALVFIDVTLSRDAVQLTNETFHSPEKEGSGGLISQSKTQKKFTSSTDGTESGQKPELSTEVTEIDYLIDRRMEQVVKGEGTIERMTISVMVNAETDTSELGAIERLVANAVGFDDKRGDAIEVALLPVSPVTMPEVLEMETYRAPEPTMPVAVVPSRAVNPLWLVGGLCLLLLIVIATMLFLRSNRAELTMTEAQRREMLAEVQSWLKQDANAQSKASS